jgi:hypothetical protein
MSLTDRTARLRCAAHHDDRAIDRHWEREDDLPLVITFLTVDGHSFIPNVFSPMA